MAEDIAIFILIGSESVGEGEGPRLDSLEVELMATGRRTGARFDGNSFGGGNEVAFYFEARNPRRFLQAAREVLQRYKLLDEASAMIGIASSALTIKLAHDPDAWVFPPKKKKRAIRKFDYFAIPLPDGTWRHAVYRAQVLPIGDFVMVLDVHTTAPSSLNELRQSRPLFPPVGLPVRAAVDEGGWRYVGNHKDESIGALPEMRSSLSADEMRAPRVYDDWNIIEFDLAGGYKYRRVGTLTEDQRRLEVLRWWPYKEFLERLITGLNPDALLL